MSLEATSRFQECLVLLRLTDWSAGDLGGGNFGKNKIRGTRREEIFQRSERMVSRALEHCYPAVPTNPFPPSPNSWKPNRNQAKGNETRVI